MKGEERDAKCLELRDRLGEIECEMYELLAERTRISEREDELGPEAMSIRATIRELEDMPCEYTEDGE